MNVYFYYVIRKKLTFGVCSKGGRNFLGRVCVNGRSRLTKRRCYKIDFFRNLNLFGFVLKIFKEPSHSGFIGLILYDNGLCNYILLSENVKRFEKIYSGVLTDKFLVKNNCWAVPLISISLFSSVHSIAINPSVGAQLVRSAGSGAIFVGKVGNKAIIKLNSGWVLFTSILNFAVLGIVSNSYCKFLSVEKAGKMRALGFKPKVRGVAKNPCDHPHGGGNGKKSKPVNPVSAWGRFTVGVHSKNKQIDVIKRRNFKN